MSAPTIASTDAFVEQAHRGQLYGDEPYVNHVRRVAHRLAAHGEWAVMAGLLHDWVEDCDGDLDALYDMGYPNLVVEAVDAVSLRENETYDELIARAAAHPLGCRVKLADNLDNSAQLYDLAETDPERATRLRAKYATARDVLLPAMLKHEREAQLAGLTSFGPPVTLPEPTIS